MAYMMENDALDERVPMLDESINPSMFQSTSFDPSKDATKDTKGEPSKKRRRGCFQCCCGFFLQIWWFFFPPSIENKRTGTIVSSILVLLNSCLGGGILAVPYGFMSTGIIAGSIFAIFFGILGAFTMAIICYGLIYAEREHKKTITNYQDFIGFYLGPIMKKFVEVLLVLYMAGACVSYLCIIGDSFQPLLQFYIPESSPLSFLAERKLIIIIFTVLIVYPLTLLRKTKSLDVASFWSNFFVVLLCFIVVIKCSTYLSNNDADISAKILVFNPSLYENQIPRCFLAIPIIAFAYQCHVIIVPIIAELQNPTFCRCLVIIVCAFSTSMVLSLITGIFGVIQFGQNVNPDILLSYPGNSPLAIFGRAMIGVVATLTYPVLFFNDRLALTTLTLRHGQLKEIFFYSVLERRTGEYVLNLKTIPFIILSGFMFMVILGIALLVPNIVVAYGFIGSIGSVTLMLTLPACVLGWFIFRKFLVSCPGWCRWCGLIFPSVLVVLGLVLMTVGVLSTAWKIAFSP